MAASWNEVPVLATRREFSQERLRVLEKKIAGVAELSSFPDLSIYITGSYGRLHANERSDLDLFFIAEKALPPNINQTVITAEIIKIARGMGFPEFSKDGEYLKVHSLPKMLQQLGGPEDDYQNFFTARLLLLLESRPVYNEAAYRRILKSIIDAYFRDYHDHVKDFKPIFLVNDILRFWKTLCLNYERNRNEPPETQDDKNKHHVKNLKLKFSRLLICFSTVIPLSVSPNASPERILELTQMPPLDRLKTAVQDNTGRETYTQIVELYSWFMNTTANPSLQNWIGERRNRRDAFGKGDEFGKLMFKLLTELVPNNGLRFLII